MDTGEQKTPPEETLVKPYHPGEPSRSKALLLGVALVVLVSIAGGVGGGWLAALRYAQPGTQVERERVVLESQGELISSIANDVGESVVSVTVKTLNTSFFGNAEQLGAGTGIILTDDGLIVTNRHVVPAGNTKASVMLSDGTEYDGVEVVGRTGTQDSLDVAFLKIADTKGKKLRAAKIGDSAKVKIGDPVIAIGNALGQFQNTVTSGIISGHGRSIQAFSGDGLGGGTLENLFQTDAAINEGNSGGPLVNLNGEVIGVNTAVASGSAQNIGFAIPVNDITGLIASVKEKGTLERPFLGVIYIALTNDAAEEFGLSVTRGAFIPPAGTVNGDSVIDGGPAAAAGVQEGDIITRLGAKAVDDRNSLSALVNQHRVGDKVELTILRGDQELKLTATLGAAPEN